MSRFCELSPQQQAELWACLALRHAEGIGSSRAIRLVRAYTSAFAAVTTGLRTPGEWTERGCVPLPLAQQFAAERWRPQALREWQAIQQGDHHFILWESPNYPALLRQLSNPPLLFYYKGDTSLLHSPALGVVGSRNCTQEGLAVGAFLSRGVSKAGVTIISGMAQGIDRVAHLAGLEGPGASVAVMGTGIDCIYPYCNADLAELLATKGLIISEFPPSTPAAPRQFPIRNRLISGLALGVLVVEATGRSGSLITARLALEQNKEVFAVPGHTMAPMSEGCRELIRQGAKVVFSADDILTELAPRLRQEEQNILAKRQANPPTLPTARYPKQAWHTSMQTGVEPVLPEGDLPWVAPVLPQAQSNTPKKQTSSVKKQAPLVISRQDIPKINPTPVPLPALTLPEQALVNALSANPLHIDALARSLSMDIALTSSLLTLLEVRGVVHRAPGMHYSLPDHGGDNAR